MTRGGNVKSLEYQCCGISPGNRESHQVLCDQIVRRSHWAELLDFLLIFIACLSYFFLPAFLLALPDCVFSLRYECEKQDRRTEDRGLLADRLHRTRKGHDEINQDDDEDDGSIAVYDASPLTISTLLFEFVQRLPD